jgi:hypothetical protein
VVAGSVALVTSFIGEKELHVFCQECAMEQYETGITYDMDAEETVPCLVVLKNPPEEEVAEADERWSGWLAMQDW